VSHDLYRHRVKQGKADGASELRVSRMTTSCSASFAVVLGIVFEKQNIAFMVSLAFAIAASANFPVLLMSVLWKELGTTRGAGDRRGFLGLGIVESCSRWLSPGGVGSDDEQPERAQPCSRTRHRRCSRWDSIGFVRHLAFLDSRQP
jgi:hypothetical protein